MFEKKKSENVAAPKNESWIKRHFSSVLIGAAFVVGLFLLLILQWLITGIRSISLEQLCLIQMRFQI